MNQIPKPVIIETKDVLINFFERANEKEIEAFKQNPVEFLKQIGVAILNRVRSEDIAKLNNELRKDVSNFLSRTGQVIRNYARCVACKIAIRAIIYAILAALGIGIAALSQHIDDIANALATFFNETVNTIRTFLNNWGIGMGLLDVIVLNDLIGDLCKEYGYCN